MWTSADRRPSRGGQIAEISDAACVVNVDPSQPRAPTTTLDNETECGTRESRMRAEFRMYESIYPRVIATAKTCLRYLARKAATVSYTTYPREFFVQLQVSQTASGLMRKIAKRYLTLDDVHHDIGNLFFLWDLLKHDENSCVGLLNFTKSLVHSMAELSGMMEQASDAINWISVQKALQVKRKQKARESVIPKLKDIKPTKTLGKGGFGCVYKVTIGGVVLTAKLVSLDKFSNARSASADKLAVSMAQGPFLVTYHSCFCADKAFVTVMEYVRGVDLSRVIKTMGPFDEDILATLLAQVCLATFYLHIQGIIHRDIKPSNIMILPIGRIKLLDYDTCKVCVGLYGDGMTETYRRKTFMEFHDGESAGTPAFLAPEIIAKARYGRASDWWSVGAAAYQLASGALPFRGNHIDKMKKKIRAANFVAPRESSPPFRSLLKGFLRKTVGRRLTCARFEEIVTHSFFSSISWDTLEDVQIPYRLDHIFAELMDLTESGAYSPRENVMNPNDPKMKRRKLLSFAEVSESELQVELYTYWSEWMATSIGRLNRRDGIVPPTSDTDYIRRSNNIYSRKASNRLKEFRQ